MKISIICCLFLISFHAILAQPQAEKGTNDVLEFHGIIKGRVVDGTTGEPLPYSNIVIYNQKDSTLVTGSIAGEVGNFEIGNSPFGHFYLEVKYIGYNKKIYPDINLSPDNLVFDLGTIPVSQSAEQLQEVRVTAERSPVEYHIDKKVVHVEENLNSAGGSAAQALNNAPSITVDVDGNVLLRGSSSFTVLIDGKPSPLEGSEALHQIPASAVEDIQILTNPSARYDPDGLSGIINIITKKRSLDGFSGIVNLSAGTGDKYRGDYRNMWIRTK